MLPIIPIEIAKTASSGAWSMNTSRITGAILEQIIIDTATGTTTFDLSITDDYNNVVWSVEGATGGINEQVYIPMRGMYTISVTNSSADEAYTGRLMLEA